MVGCGSCGERVRVVPGMVGTATGMGLTLRWAIYNKATGERQGQLTYELVSDADTVLDSAFAGDRARFEVRSVWV